MSLTNNNGKTRQPLSALPVNTSLPYDATTTKTSTDEGLKKTAPTRASETIDAAAQHVPPAAAYPPLRTVLPVVTIPHTDHVASPIAHDAQDAPDATFEENASHIVSVHPPSSAKPQMPSRRSSLARLRQHSRLSTTPNHEATADVADLAAGEAFSPPVATMEDGTAKTHSADGGSGPAGLQVFSYRPTLTTPSPATSTDVSGSHEGKGVAGLTGTGKAENTAAATAATATAKAWKVLPMELRSPSGITEVGAVPDISRGISHDTLSSSCRTSMDTFDAEGRGDAHRSHKLRGTGNERGGDAARNPPQGEADVGDGDAISAHFHALQFVPPSSHDAFLSPPHSGRSEVGEDGKHTGSESYKALPRDAAPSTKIVTSTSKKRSQDGGGARSCGDCDAVSAEDSSELIVCPFALFGCCPRGTHTNAEVTHNTTLHHHLVAVASCLQRMKARQQQLEQTVVLLQNQVHTQAHTIQETRSQLEEYHKTYRAEPQTAPRPETRRGGSREAKTGGFDKPPFLSLHSLVDVSLSGSTLSSNDQRAAGDAHGTHERRPARKAFPGDVSIHEPQVTEYGIDDEDETNDDDEDDKVSPERMSRHSDTPAEKEEGGGTGVYARQLRLRTRSAKQLYALRESPTDEATTAGAGGADQKRKLIGSGGDVSEAGNAGVSADTLSGEKGNKKGPDGMPSRGGQHKTPVVEAAQLPVECGNKKTQRLTTTTTAAAATEEKRLRRLASPTAGASSSSATPSSSTRPGYPYAVQRGACGSTEVSGMSNVPAYQLPDESVSSIRSASFDLDDHDDDAEVGEMRQHLMRLTTQAAIGNIGGAGAANAAATKLHRPREDFSARSIPSMVSTTYRPSQLAGAPAVPSVEEREGEITSAAAAVTSVAASGGSSPSKRVAAPSSGSEGRSNYDHHPRTPLTSADMVPFAAADTVRHAVPLQRPMLIRKTDVVPERTQGGTPHGVLLPRPTSATTITTAASFNGPHPKSAQPALPAVAAPATATAPPTPSSGIMQKVAGLKARRLSALDSEGRRVPTVGISEKLTESGEESSDDAARGSLRGVKDEGPHHTVPEADENSHEGAGGSDKQRFASSPSMGTRHTPTHAHSYHHVDDVEEGCADSRSTLVVATHRRRKSSSGDRAEGEQSSARRKSLSRSRHDAAAAASRRPEHATSMLSTKEAAELSESVPLGLPPRRREEV